MHKLATQICYQPHIDAELMYLEDIKISEENISEDDLEPPQLCVVQTM